MSYSATKWAWNVEGIRSTQRLVLLALAWEADGEGVCDVSVDALMTLTSLTKQGVLKCIRELETMGFVSRKRGHRSVCYKVNTVYLRRSMPFTLEDEVKSTPFTLHPSKVNPVYLTGDKKEEIPQTPLEEKTEALKLEGEGGAKTPPATTSEQADFRGWPDASECPITRDEALAMAASRCGLSEADVDEWWGYWQGKGWRMDGGEKMERRHVWRRFGNWKATAEAIKARNGQEAKHGGNTATRNNGRTGAHLDGDCPLPW